MQKFNKPITDIIKERFSCRAYSEKPVEIQKQEQLKEFIKNLPAGPFGSLPRFELLAATETDSSALKGLGTYGFIKNPSAFIVGAMSESKYNHEDFGYLMEVLILFATSIELGTCWLGGTFTKSRFAKKIDLKKSETIPAATSLGNFMSPEQQRMGWASRTAGSFRRIEWEELFFDGKVDVPLTRELAGDYAEVLDMVRIYPSASNRQPCRIVKHGQSWRFYMRRTPGYRRDTIKKILDLCDLQRIDMGIAMSHFELTAQEMGLKGEWVVEEEAEKQPDEMTEYIVSWKSSDK